MGYRVDEKAALLGDLLFEEKQKQALKDKEKLSLLRTNPDLYDLGSTKSDYEKSLIAPKSNFGLSLRNPILQRTQPQLETTKPIIEPQSQPFIRPPQQKPKSLATLLNLQTTNDTDPAVEKKANEERFWTQLSNFGKTLGRGNSAANIDPTAPTKAAQMVRDDYYKRRKEPDILKNIRLKDELEKRNPNSKLANNLREYLKNEHNISGLAGQSSLEIMRNPYVRNIKKKNPEFEAKVRKLQAEASLKEEQVRNIDVSKMQTSQLVDNINNSGRLKYKVTADMSKPQLEQLYRTILEEDIDYKKAKAMGGGKGKEFGTDGRGPSEVGKAIHKEVREDLNEWLSPSEQESINRILSDTSLSGKEKKEYLQEYRKRAFGQKDRAEIYAEKVMGEFIHSPTRNTVEIYTELIKLKDLVKGSGDIAGWNMGTSTIRKVVGGEETVNAFTDDPKIIELFKQINNVEQAFARSKSGAAIGKLEWDKFKNQIGSGAMSDDQQLRIGVRNISDSIRSTVENTWNSVDRRVRYDPGYLNRLKVFDIKKPKYESTNDVLDKYGVK